MRILHVNSSDLGGGAERVATQLCIEARTAGHDARLAVGRKLGDDVDVSAIEDAAAGGAWRRFWLGRGGGRLARGIADPLRVLDRAMGREDFRFPASHGLGADAHPSLDILHLHNLHGGYFDLRALPGLCRRQPTFITMHDPWLLAGHCAHPFDCGRWEHGCGECPDLDVYPAIRRDATAANWRRKAAIYRDSRLFLATPSRWLMQRVERSMLRPGIAEARVIPNGIDLDVFNPADRDRARVEAGFERDDLVVLFAAKALQRNRFRDHRTLREAIERVAAEWSGKTLNFVALGQHSDADETVEARVRFVPFEADPQAVARHYRAADLFVHATRADTYPNVVLEASACGTPVVASRIGGIPEQIVPDRTGELVPAEDVELLTAAIVRMLDDAPRRRAMGEQAAAEARRRYDARQMAREYLSWYAEVRSVDGPSGDQSGDRNRSKASHNER
jgi:glycosyltransferase involved in cell wall biosynthesis